jgi:hypothetical protein
MADRAAHTGRRRSIWGTAALVLTALSILGFILLAVGDAANWSGFSEEDESTTGGDASWISFSLGAILALIIGVIAFVQGRRRRRASDTRAGQIAIGWFVVAVLLTAIFASLA